MIQKVGPPSFDTHFTDNVLAGNVKLMQRSVLKTTIEHFHSPETETLFDLTTKFKQQQIVAFFNKIRNRRKSWPP